MKWMALLALLVIVLNLIASFFVFRIKELSTTQRLLQVALVWLLPVIGATVCLAFATSLETPARPTSDSNIGVDANDCHGPIIAGGAADFCNGDSGGDGGGGSD